MLKKIPVVLFAAVAAVVIEAAPACAYIGPGAGFALATSFFAIFATFIIVFGVLAMLPARLLFRALRRGGRVKSAKQDGFKRLVIVGLDGLDPRIAGELIAKGEMPNFSEVAEKGHFGPLATTCPSVSPVAWSTFSTGLNPGRHGIFDFLDWDRVNYLPKLSSTEIGGTRRPVGFGPFRLQLGRPAMKLLRKGKPFWDIIAESGEPAMVLRVPITFPAEKSPAMLLSGMCAPDLRGSQGTYSFFTTEDAQGAGATSAECGKLRAQGTLLVSELTGPPNPFKEGDGPLKVAFSLEKKEGGAVLRIKGQPPVMLKTGEYSDWVSVSFKASAGVRVPGIARFLLTETGPHTKLYVSPVNIDPSRPALPVSNPMLFSVWMSKLLGRFSTLGLAEDTWALNQGHISREQFLGQVYLNHGDREKMLNLALDTIKSGLVVCVFDTPDRVQHMFYRQHVEGQSAESGPYTQTLLDMYKKMDELIGRVRARLRPGDVMFVISDHGVRAFDRCVNVNTWLMQNGWLALKADAQPDADYYQAVDWERTKAFALGLAGIYINTKGKGSRGIVEPGEELDALKKEIAGKLRGLADPKDGRVAVRDVFEAAMIYNGPYIENSPDLVVCFEDGFRTSWDSVTGRVMPDVFSDNERAWSGDHCVDPRLVPGILLSTTPVTLDKPHIRDISAAALKLFGIPQPENMQGRPLF